MPSQVWLVWLMPLSFRAALSGFVVALPALCESDRSLVEGRIRALALLPVVESGLVVGGNLMRKELRMVDIWILSGGGCQCAEPSIMRTVL